eukprot:170539_1
MFFFFLSIFLNPKEIAKYRFRIQCKVDYSFCSKVLKKKDPGTRDYITFHISEMDITDEDIEFIANYIQALQSMIDVDIQKMKRRKKFISRTTEDVVRKFKKMFDCDDD